MNMMKMIVNITNPRNLKYDDIVENILNLNFHELGQIEINLGVNIID